jgi:TatD DNase family protein
VHGLIDTHCHLTLEEFSPDLDQVISSAFLAGIHKIVVPAVDLESSRKAVSLAHQYPQLYAAVGVHPEASRDYTEGQMAELRDLAQDPIVVGIGEIGLDFHYPPVNMDQQKHVFEQMLQLAESVRKPVLVHSRDAMDEVLQTLEGWIQHFSSTDADSLSGHPGILHAFEGNLVQARQAVDLHLVLGMGGPITYKNSDMKKSIAQAMDLHDLVLETDAPYLPPSPFRGKRNEPAYIREICHKLAEIRNESFEMVAAGTSSSASRIFNWEN